MPGLRLRSPFRKAKEDLYDVPTSPTGAYTGEQIPTATRGPKYPFRLVILLITCVFLTYLFLNGFVSKLVPFAAPSGSRHESVKKQSFVPEFERYAVDFEDDPVFRDRGMHGHHAWQNMLPRGGGKVSVPFPGREGLERHGLPLSGEVEGAEAYGVAVARQLQCLVSAAVQEEDLDG